MQENQEVVHFQMDHAQMRTQSASKALQLKIDNNKTVVIYNHVNGYILDALLKAVF